MPAVRLLGIDIGTASSKAVLVDEKGTLLASATRGHETSSPHPGWFEHDAEGIWWSDLRTLANEILAAHPGPVAAVSVSGIGPCALIADDSGRPLRPAILYGIDRRAEREIEELTDELGADEVLRRTGNILTTQAVGPKLRWFERHEPDGYAQARRWYTASSYLVERLTGEYTIDVYTASASDPFVELATLDWWAEGWAASAHHIARPRLAWPSEIVGEVSATAAAETGLARGTPVLAGTTDALAEAYSVGCRAVGDTMVMYGSTLFLILTVATPAAHPGLWAASGLRPGTYSAAAGMATSGLVTTWLAGIAQTDIADLVAEADAVPPGCDGLVLLPYFAGERTPLFDPSARGCWLGLTLDHTRGHLYRSVLEGVGYGVRHNLETMVEAGGRPTRLVAVGGGTRRSLWTQIVSDITGLPQDIATTTIGAAYGDTRMAADALGVDTVSWNPIAHRIEPDPANAGLYEELYGVYRRMYPALRDDMHLLARATT